MPAAPHCSCPGPPRTTCLPLFSSKDPEERARGPLARLTEPETGVSLGERDPVGATETVQRFNGPKPYQLWSLGYCAQGWSFPAPQARARAALRFGVGRTWQEGQHRTKEEGSEAERASGYLSPLLVPPLGSSRPRQGCRRAIRFPQPRAAPYQPQARTRQTRALLRGLAEPSRCLASSRPRLRTALWEVWFPITSSGGPPPPHVLSEPSSAWVAGVFTRLGALSCRMLTGQGLADVPKTHF